MSHQRHGQIRIILAAALLIVAGIVLFVIRPFGSKDPAAPREHTTAGANADQPTETAAADISETSHRDEWQQLDNPSDDGWDTETFNLAASKQFKKLGELLAKPEGITAAALTSLAVDHYSGGNLVPAKKSRAYEDQSFTTVRASDGETAATDNTQHDGRNGLSDSLRQITNLFSGATDFRSKFKIFAVTPNNGTTTTQQYVELAGRLPAGILEQHATWEAIWITRADGPPLLTSLKLLDFEQTQITTPAGSLFTDCTPSVLAHNSCYAEQLLYGLPYWLARTQNTRSFTSLGNPGVALGDVNGDGLDDLYLCQEQGIPNRLFLQREDGTLDDVSREWEVDWLHNSRSALLIDLDNDGDQDLVVAFLGGVAVASNEAGTRFQVRTVLETSDDQMSISAADYDSDGDLDLYAAAYYPDRFLGESSTPGVVPESSGNFVLHDANTGGRNSLHRNDIAGDDWAFSDVTESVGLEANNTRLTFAPAWDDYDNDGDQDLYVANDFGRDNMYRNDDGHFVEVSDSAGAEDSATGMGTAWGDFNRDGWMDVHVSNMWSSAGGRITYQPQFKANAAPEVKRRLQRIARGNSLLRNDGKQHFEDVSAFAQVEMGRWAWASQFGDINNDAWEDIIVCNGYITGDGDGGDL